MKKLTLLCALLVGSAVTGLVAADAPVVTATPIPNAPAVTGTNPGDAATGKKTDHKRHRKHHKKKAADPATTPPASPKS